MDTQTQNIQFNPLGAAVQGYELGARINEQKQQAAYKQAEVQKLQREAQSKQALEMLTGEYVNNGSTDALGKIYALNPEHGAKIEAYHDRRITDVAKNAQAFAGISLEDKPEYYKRVLADLTPQEREKYGLTDDYNGKDSDKKLKFLSQASRSVEEQLKDPTREADLQLKKAQAQEQLALARKTGTETTKNQIDIAERTQGGIMSPQQRAQQVKDFSKYQTDVIADTKTARGTLDSLNQVESHLKNLSTGKGTETINSIKSLAKTLGLESLIDVKALSNAETAQAQIHALLLPMTKSLGTGNGFTDKDREFLEKVLPSLANTKEGNAQIIEYLRKAANRKVEVAKKVQEYKKQGITDPLEIELKIGEWADQNPLFEQKEKVTPGGMSYAPNAGGNPFAHLTNEEILSKL